MTLRLRDHLANVFNNKKKRSIKVQDNPRAMAKLLKEAERVKKVLSANNDHMAQVVLGVCVCWVCVCCVGVCVLGMCVCVCVCVRYACWFVCVCIHVRVCVCVRGRRMCVVEEQVQWPSCSRRSSKSKSFVPTMTTWLR